MQLSYNQKRHLIENGYVVIPGVVPKLMLQDAMKAVNHAIGKAMHSNEAEHRTPMRQLSGHPALVNLFNGTPAKAIMDSLIGQDYNPIQGVQAALRYPDYPDPPDPQAGAHLDGMLKIKEGKVENFTALAGILLSDQPRPNMGNFVVYPGSHRLYEAYFREHGAEVLLTEESFGTMHRSPHVPLPDPVQITGQAGDLVISHYQLIHNGGPNISDRIRYSCYYRIYHSHIQRDWKAPLIDMWKHWPGLEDETILNEVK